MILKDAIINEMDFEFGKEGVTGFENGKGFKPNQFSKHQMEDKTAVAKYLQKKGLFPKIATKNDVSSLDIIKRVDGFIVNFDDGGSMKIPNSALGFASTDTEEDEDKIEEDYLNENNDIADAKQKLELENLKKQLREEGWEIRSFKRGFETKKGSDLVNSTYVLLRPLKPLSPVGNSDSRIFSKMDKAVYFNFRTNETLLLLYPNSFDEIRYKFELPEKVKTLCRKIHHAKQTNFNKPIHDYFDEDPSETFLRDSRDRYRNTETYKKIKKEQEQKRKKAISEYKKAKENGATPEELKKLEAKFLKELHSEIAFNDNIDGDSGFENTLKGQALKRELEKNKKIANINSGKKYFDY